ncbi:MAG: hypothetical protein HC911_16135 [Chloroflexaceae bacterium]|nr:hypothetical protein [Chloroflexaceae bacterium]
MDTTTKYTLTIIDTTGIQAYIFGSNRLRENIGASQLVQHATSEYVRQALQHALGEHHDLAKLASEPPLEHTPDRRCEVIYAGGGNVLLLFRTPDDAKKTVRELSKLLHTHAPDLRIAAAHLPFDWDTDLLGQHDGNPGVLAHLYAELGKRKQLGLPEAPPLALGVTLACASTGLPAVAPDEPDQNQSPRFISAATLGKLDARDAADQRFQNILTTITSKYAIPKDFDDLGRSRDQQSYIAVVHLDGNGMGQRFEKAGANASTNREFIEAVRSLSSQINQAAMTALNNTLIALTDMLAAQPDHETEKEVQLWLQSVIDFCDNLAKDGKSGLHFLPFRPLVFGGDDVTFVCDGRLGLALAHRFLIEFEQATSDLLGETAYACAGVAIVKSHYPFARAYALAEELCQNAKRALRNADISNCSALDWHIVASGRTDSISAIREREYANSTLTARPLLLCDLPPTHPYHSTWQHRTWAHLRDTVYKFNYSDAWRERRNKVLALREVLRQGDDAVKQFKIRYNITTLPHEDHAVLFDTIETMEFLLPLEPPILYAKEQPTHA